MGPNMHVHALGTKSQNLCKHPMSAGAITTFSTGWKLIPRREGVYLDVVVPPLCHIPACDTITGGGRVTHFKLFPPVERVQKEDRLADSQG